MVERLEECLEINREVSCYILLNNGCVFVYSVLYVLPIGSLILFLCTYIHIVHVQIVLDHITCVNYHRCSYIILLSAVNNDSNVTSFYRNLYQSRILQLSEKS